MYVYVCMCVCILFYAFILLNCTWLTIKFVYIFVCMYACMYCNICTYWFVIFGILFFIVSALAVKNKAVPVQVSNSKLVSEVESISGGSPSFSSQPINIVILICVCIACAFLVVISSGYGYLYSGTNSAAKSGIGRRAKSELHTVWSIYGDYVRDVCRVAD